MIVIIVLVILTFVIVSAVVGYMFWRRRNSGPAPAPISKKSPSPAIYANTNNTTPPAAINNVWNDSNGTQTPPNSTPNNTPINTKNSAPNRATPTQGTSTRAEDADLDGEDITTPSENTIIPTATPVPTATPDGPIVGPIVAPFFPGYTSLLGESWLGKPAYYGTLTTMVQVFRSQGTPAARSDPFAATSKDFFAEKVTDVKFAINCKAQCDTMTSCIAFVHDKDNNKCIILAPRMNTDINASLLELKLSKGSYKSIPGGSIKSLASELYRRDPMPGITTGPGCREACDALDTCQATVVQGQKCYLLHTTGSPNIDTYIKA